MTYMNVFNNPMSKMAHIIGFTRSDWNDRGRMGIDLVILTT